MVNLTAIIAIASSLTLILVLGQTIYPRLRTNWKLRKLEQGVEILNLQTFGTMLSQPNQLRLLPIVNIRVPITNESKYSTKVRCSVLLDGNPTGLFGGLSDKTRSTLSESYLLEPYASARCFFSRLMMDLDSQWERAGKSVKIGPPGAFAICAPPGIETDAWLEFIEEVPPGVHGGGWTAREGMSIPISVYRDLEITVIVRTPAKRELDRRTFTVSEMVRACKSANWTRSAEIRFGESGKAAVEEGQRELREL